MADYLRIIDRFEIAERGTAYVVEKNKEAEIRTGDKFSDLRGNCFVISGMEMVCRRRTWEDFDDMPFTIMLKSLDGVDVAGTILVRGNTKLNFLFCNHPLFPQRVDEDFEQEYQAAGLEHACALFSYENLEMGKLKLYGEEITGITVYRGWMMKPELYSQFYRLLEERNIFLINSPDEYEHYHLLPNWYDDFKGLTPESVWESEGNVDNAMRLAKGLSGPYIVKDYVKSRKHEWHYACFINNIADVKQTNKVITNFVNRQGPDLTGGIVLRKFEKLKQLGFHEKSGMPISEEYRVFIFAGQVLIADDYWRKDEKIHFSEEEKKWIDTIAGKIKSNFVTMDLARKEDGTLMIMEFGDGQVSGLQQIEPKYFYFEFEQGKSIPVEELFPEGIVILAGDPMPDKTLEEMQSIIEHVKSWLQLNML